MKNYIKLSELKLEKEEQLKVIGGCNGNCYCKKPEPVLRYAITPLYGIILPQPE